MPGQHALLSASAADRWMLCPGSVMATKDYPDTSSTAADEGTLAHALGELKLRKLFGIPEPMSRAKYGSQHKAIEADELYSVEMENCSDTYVEQIQSVVMQAPQRPFIAVEFRVDFSDVVPDGFGTSDCIVITPDTIHIFDYKHGKGVKVSATENRQLRLYALGALKAFAPFFPGIRYVVLHIIQPRLDNICEWKLTVEELVSWGDDTVKPAANLALSPDAPFHPGEKQCKFCKIRATCRARMVAATELHESPGFGKMPPEITDAEIADAIALGKDVSDWYKKLSEYAAKKLESGGAIPGLKLVAGRTTRTWDDQNTAFADLIRNGIPEAVLYEKTPVSVPGLEKLIDKQAFARFVVPHMIQSPGKPALVPESDPRKPWSPAKADFAEIIKSKKED